MKKYKDEIWFSNEMFKANKGLQKHGSIETNEVITGAGIPQWYSAGLRAG
jgi:hypothetical protein